MKHCTGQYVSTWLAIPVFLVFMLLGCSSPHSSEPDVEAYSLPTDSNGRGWSSPDHPSARIYEPSVLPLEHGQIREPLCFGDLTSDQKGRPPLLVFIVDGLTEDKQVRHPVNRMATVRDILQYIVENLPPEVTVGLIRHEEKNPNDCNALEFLVQPDCNDKGVLFSKLETGAAENRVSITGALRLISKIRAQQKAVGDETLIFLLSDGQQPCDDKKQCELVRNLKAAKDNFVLNVIGFGDNGQQQSSSLQCLAEAGGGVYMAAQDRDALSLFVTTVLAKKIEQQVQQALVPCLTVALQMDTPEELRFIGSYTHDWYADFRLWSEAVAKSLKEELEARHCSVGPGAKKTLRLQVTNSRISWFTRKIRCQVDMSVQTGDNAQYFFSEFYTDTDLFGSCDGAVRQVTAAVLNSEDIRHYLQGRKQITAPPHRPE